MFCHILGCSNNIEVTKVAMATFSNGGLVANTCRGAFGVWFFPSILRPWRFFSRFTRILGQVPPTWYACSIQCLAVCVSMTEISSRWKKNPRCGCRFHPRGFSKACGGSNNNGGGFKICLKAQAGNLPKKTTLEVNTNTLVVVKNEVVENWNSIHGWLLVIVEIYICFFHTSLFVEKQTLFFMLHTLIFIRLLLLSYLQHTFRKTATNNNSNQQPTTNNQQQPPTASLHSPPPLKKSTLFPWGKLVVPRGRRPQTFGFVGDNIRSMKRPHCNLIFQAQLGPRWVSLGSGGTMGGRGCCRS